MDVLGLLAAGVVCLRRDVYTGVRLINREPDADLTLGRNDTSSPSAKPVILPICIPVRNVHFV